MSRKVILTLATAATIAAAGLASSAADARSFGGGGGGFGHSSSIGRVGGGHFSAKGGRKLTSILNPDRPGRPDFPGHPGHWTGLHHHGHWIFRGGRWIIIDDVVDEVPVVEPAPGPCTCLTKNYTPDGLVVFADLCTKESASARVDGKAADATRAPTVGDKAANATPVPAPSNYAGLTYSDYLAANPQAAAQAAPKN
jgi:hypothetical protein